MKKHPNLSLYFADGPNPQHCTTDQYGNVGCIGTAATAHGGTLPMTGFNDVSVVLIALVAVIVGLIIRIGRRTENG